MPHYFMHLIDGIDRLLDPDGVEMPAHGVGSAALRAARDCMAGDVHDGRLDLRYRIEVQDQRGAVVHRLEFADALKIISAEAVG